MIWGNPIAAWALLALAAPIVVHLLVRRRARPIPFPTLRFIPRTRLASVEQRTLEDALLLAVRIAAIAAAVAAIGAPFLMTKARQRAWDAVTIRAEVASGITTRGAAARSFSSDTLSGGIDQALAWLATQPPARRQLILRSAFAIGSIGDDDVARIPKNIGLRLERSGNLPMSRTFQAASVISGKIGSTVRVEREARLDGGRTSVRALAGGLPAGLPIEISAPDSRRSSVDDLLRGIVAEGVPVPIGNRTARIELADPTASADRETSVREIRSAWMANAIDRILHEARSRSSMLASARFSGTGDRLTVRVDATIPDSDLARLIRLVLTAMGPAVERPNEEILAIPDAQLLAWSREAGSASPPPNDRRLNDGRWFWLLALVLLAAEASLRSSSRQAADATEAAPSDRQRVA